MYGTLAEQKSEGKPEEKVLFDTKALNGLRGFAALHISIFHATLFSQLNLDTLAEVRYLVMNCYLNVT